MKTACIGGGPAGLYLGILLKLANPRHQVTVFERGRADEVAGFGVVLAEATLAHLGDADPVSHAAIAGQLACWDAVELHARGNVVIARGHGACGIERRTLLAILQERAGELGVDLRFATAISSLDQVASADLVVGADGGGSWVRAALAREFEPQVDVRPDRYVWLATTAPFDAATYVFQDTEHGLFRAFGHRHGEAGSTFIVECAPATWRAAGLEGADAARTAAVLERVFAAVLGDHRLRADHVGWRSFASVRNRSWRAGHVVLVGDAAHTAHFSIGSGTRLAMDDAIALAAAIASEADLETALADYEVRRRPEVEAQQAAAQASMEWFEGAEHYLGLPPAQLAYSLLTRSLRVSHATMRRRDPELARAVERLVAEGTGLAGAVPPPMLSPVQLGGLRLDNRIALAPWTAAPAPDGVVGDGHLVFLGARAKGGAGLLLTELVAARGAGPQPAIGTDEQAVAWRRVVEFVHEGSAARLGLTLGAAEPAVLVEAVRRAAFAGFDLLVLDAGDGAGGSAGLDEALAVAGPAWPADRALGVRVRRDADDAAVVARVHGWRDRGVDVVVVAPGATSGGVRLACAPLADRLRNELHVAVILEHASATPDDVDAAIAAGRCDVVALGRALVIDPSFVHRAAEAAGWQVAGLEVGAP